ncbi:hypothetical protein [Actinomadura chokoriensis]|uniref:Tetracycline repressor TetR C-terminal domain-containing protein n=1 Tax=Actinomadura chokoriensis TaxID=454156 RepID=A0ABV4QWP8_9ACTN
MSAATFIPWTNASLAASSRAAPPDLAAEPGGWRALNALIASGVMDRHDEPDAEFTFGLERFLDGIEFHVRSKS